MIVVLNGPLLIFVLSAFLLLLIFVGVGVILLACLTWNVGRLVRRQEKRAEVVHDRDFDDELFQSIRLFLREEDG